jgi:hypothetical protein
MPHQTSASAHLSALHATTPHGFEPVQCKALHHSASTHVAPRHDTSRLRTTAPQNHHNPLLGFSPLQSNADQNSASLESNSIHHATPLGFEPPQFHTPLGFSSHQGTPLPDIPRLRVSLMQHNSNLGFNTRHCQASLGFASVQDRAILGSAAAHSGPRRSSAPEHLTPATASRYTTRLQNVHVTSSLGSTTRQSSPPLSTHHSASRQCRPGRSSAPRHSNPAHVKPIHHSASASAQHRTYSTEHTSATCR